MREKREQVRGQYPSVFQTRLLRHHDSQAGWPDGKLDTRTGFVQFSIRVEQASRVAFDGKPIAASNSHTANATDRAVKQMCGERHGVPEAHWRNGAEIKH